MAAKGSEMALALVVVLMMWNGVRAQTGCSNALMSMAPCLNFVTGNVTKPSSACCSSLAGVVQTQPQCLCTMVNGSGAMVGLAVNQTLALSLPAACNVQTQPISQCNAASGPTTSVASPASAPVTTTSVASPASAPVGSPSSDSTPSDASSNVVPATTTTPTTTSQTNTPSSTGTGSKSTPSTTGASSGASATTSPLPVVMFISLTVSFALMAAKF